MPEEYKLWLNMHIFYSCLPVGPLTKLKKEQTFGVVVIVVVVVAVAVVVVLFFVELKSSTEENYSLVVPPGRGQSFQDGADLLRSFTHGSVILIHPVEARASKTELTS